MLLQNLGNQSGKAGRLSGGACISCAFATIQHINSHSALVFNEETAPTELRLSCCLGSCLAASHVPCLGAGCCPSVGCSACAVAPLACALAKLLHRELQHSCLGRPERLFLQHYLETPLLHSGSACLRVCGCSPGLLGELVEVVCNSPA